MKHKLQFSDLKVGHVIAAGAIVEVKGRNQFKAKHKGRVIGLDSEEQLIKLQFPNGSIEFIKWVEFIIYILPLLEKIFFTVKSWFTKNKN